MSKLDAPDSPYAALILASAGMLRLGWGPRITASLGPPTLLYAVSQGALAIEVRTDDAAARALCESITHTPTLWACGAERACLRVLEGGCSVPVGVFTRWRGPQGEGGTLEITGAVTSLDGSLHVEHTLEGKIQSWDDANGLGERLAKVLVQTGAKEILDEITKDRERRIEESAKQELAESANT